ISEKMRAQMRGLDQAGRNVQDGISVVQTAEGALEETGNIMQRMRELSVQASNETNTDEERKKIAGELDQLRQEVERISSSTEFNGKKLLNGEHETIKLQVGANFGDAGTSINIDKSNTVTNTFTVDVASTNASGDAITVQVGKENVTFGTTEKANNNNQIEITLVDTSKVMSEAGIDAESIAALTGDNTASSTDAARTMVKNLDAALKQINDSRATLGAQQNRLNSTETNLNNTLENVTAAESRIRDVDVAKEMMNLSKMNILVQASQSMLSQANQQPQGVLQLLG
ncbi:MAG: flagellin, partial [Paraclostridium sp.]